MGALLWPKAGTGTIVMGGLFHEAPYPPLQVQDFGPGKPFRVEVQNAGRTIAIGEHTDPAFQQTHLLVQPTLDVVDVVIHGLPGRFIERLGGIKEIPAAVVARLLDSAGVPWGTPLRLLTCHAGESPLIGPTAAQVLATLWGGIVQGANGLLRIRKSGIAIDRVSWDPDPVGGMIPNVTGAAQGIWVAHIP